jgi:hypothetical protein
MALSYASAMPRRYVALLRVVNVGRTGTLAMSDLTALVDSYRDCASSRTFDWRDSWLVPNRGHFG